MSIQAVRFAPQSAGGALIQEQAASSTPNATGLPFRTFVDNRCNIRLIAWLLDLFCLHSEIRRANQNYHLVSYCFSMSVCQKLTVAMSKLCKCLLCNALAVSSVEFL